MSVQRIDQGCVEWATSSEKYPEALSTHRKHTPRNESRPAVAFTALSPLPKGIPKGREGILYMKRFKNLLQITKK